MIVMHVIVMQSVSEAVGILLVARRRGPEFLEQLIGELIGDTRRGSFLPEFFQPVMDALKQVNLIPDHLWSHCTPAAADDRESFVVRSLQSLEGFYP